MAETAAALTNNTQLATTAFVHTLIGAGAVQFFARSTAPAGWIKANGAAVSRTAYADLFAAIGTTFGAGNGSTTFNLPDLRGEFPRGWDDGRGVDSGREFGSFQKGTAAAIDDTSTIATVDVLRGTVGSVGGDIYDPAAYVGTTLSRLSSGVGNEANPVSGVVSRPRNIALLACIKY